MYLLLYTVFSSLLVFGANPVGRNVFLDNGPNSGLGNSIIKASKFPEGKYSFKNDFSKFPYLNLRDKNVLIKVEYGSLLANSGKTLNLNISNTAFGSAMSSARIIYRGQSIPVSNLRFTGVPVNNWRPDRNNNGIADWHNNLLNYHSGSNNHPTTDYDNDGIPFWIEWMYSLSPAGINFPVQQSYEYLEVISNNGHLSRNMEMVKNPVIYGTPYKYPAGNLNLFPQIYGSTTENFTTNLPNDNAYLKYAQQARFILNLNTGMVLRNISDSDGDGATLQEEISFNSRGYLHIKLIIRGNKHVYVHVVEQAVQLHHHGEFGKYVPTASDRPVEGLWINGIPTGLSWSQTVHYDDESHFDRPLLITPNFNSTSEPIPSNYRNPRIQFDKDLPANVFARLVRVPLDRKNNPAMVAVIDNVNDTDQEVKIAFNYGSQPIKLGDPNDIDSDDDGLKDGFEIKVFKTNAFSSDTDEDGMNDYWEVVFGTDPKQKDSHIGNDGDSLSNYEEMLMGYHPWITDTDRDGTPDGEEDKDGDGLTFIQEWRLGLNDNDIDSDNDLLPDGYEISIGKDPTKKDDLSDRNLYPDTDGEGLPDILEVPEAYGTDPTLTDTDGDGISDYDEVFKYKSDPTNFDTDGDLIPDGVEVSVDGWNLLIPDDLEGDLDGDGVSNLQEIIYGGNPNLADTDGDGTSDYDEITQGSYINDASDNGELSDEEKENQITVKLRVGDPSGSHSERMIAIVSELNENIGERVLLNHQNKEYGTVTADNISIFKNFRKNKSYSIQLKHVGTDPSIKEKYKKNMVSYNRSFPNYDWLLEGSVINKDGSEVPLSNYFVILDPWDPLEKKVPMGATPLMGKYQTAPYGKNNKQHFIDNFENRRVLLMTVDLVPDYNRDGQISADDKGKITTDKPFYWWINDDDDVNGVEGNDVPGDGTADHSNNVVDGVRDLEDFFPVHLDVEDFLSGLSDLSKVKIKVGGSNIKVIDPEATGEIDLAETNKYLTNVSYAESLKAAAIKQSGDELGSAFVDSAKNGTSVLLVEGSALGEEPLTLEIYYDGNKIIDATMPMKLSGVEEMFKHHNIVPTVNSNGVTYKASHSLTPAVIEAGSENRSATPGLPDSEVNGRSFIFVHGYNVNQKEARGWNCEIFKRLHQSGSRARFYGITWYGYEGKINLLGKTPDYHESVTNAFLSSNALATSGIPSGPGTIIAAHSLGNMITSSAIVDHGYNPEKYFMLDAAVAAEAYDSGMINTTTWKYMSPDNWWDPAVSISATDDYYAPRLWASEWHTYFPGEVRNQLTWKDRFGAIPQAYNFYSSGEEVLVNPDDPRWTGNSPVWSLVEKWEGEGSWLTQEQLKGTTLAALATFDSHGGWGFNLNAVYEDPIQIWDDDLDGGDGDYRKRTPNETFVLTNADLAENGFFDRFQLTDSDYPTYDGNIYGAIGSNPGINYVTRAKLLAEAIPATSYCAGSNEVLRFNDFGARNFNMPEEFRSGWPSEERDDDFWLHSDLMNVGYVYLYALYDEFVGEGNLDEE